MSSVPVLELFHPNIPEGQLAKCITKNRYFNVTIRKVNDHFINVVTNQSLSLTKELLMSEFELVNEDKQISISELADALAAGRKIKLVVEDKYRYVQIKKESEEKDFIMGSHSLLQAFSFNQVITLEELVHGEFYLSN